MRSAKAWSARPEEGNPSPYKAPTHQGHEPEWSGRVGEKPMLHRRVLRYQANQSTVVIGRVSGVEVPDDKAYQRRKNSRLELWTQRSGYRGCLLWNGMKRMMSNPQMTEHTPYKGFVLDPRLSEMSVQPDGWTPPRETSQGIKIPNRSHDRNTERQELGAPRVNGGEQNSSGKHFPGERLHNRPLASLQG